MNQVKDYVKDYLGVSYSRAGEDWTMPAAQYRRTVWFALLGGTGAGIIVGYFIAVLVSAF